MNTPPLPVYLRLNPIFHRMYNNVHDNDLSELVLIVGRTGLGKSCTALLGMIALDIAMTVKTEYAWKSRFDLDRCVFSAKPFIEFMTKQDENYRQWFPKGTCFLLDEVNVEAGNLDFQDYKTKAVVTSLQTTRKYNYIIFMTSPDWKSVAIGIRRRATCIIELLKKGKQNGKPVVFAKVSWIDQNNRTGQVFFKFHRAWVRELIDANGNDLTYVWRKKRYSKVVFPKIPQVIEDSYNKRKDLALKNFRERILQELEYYKNFLGKTKEAPRSKVEVMEELKAAFTQDGEIEWSKLVHRDKVNKVMIEDYLLEKKIEWPSERHILRLKNWLAFEHSKLEDGKKEILSKRNKLSHEKHVSQLYSKVAKKKKTQIVGQLNEGETVGGRGNIESRQGDGDTTEEKEPEGTA